MWLTMDGFAWEKRESKAEKGEWLRDGMAR